jgi:hypothetical protein
MTQVQVQSKERAFLDRSKLPAAPTIQKASFYEPAYRFGTMYTVDRNTYEEYAGIAGCPSYLEAEHPLTGDLVIRSDQIPLPDGWRIEKCWKHTLWHDAEYVSVSLVVVHSPSVTSEGCVELIDRDLEFVSAALLRKSCFANRAIPRRRSRKKFTPLIITPREYRFFLYRPDREVVERGVATFERVLKGLQGLPRILPDIQRDLRRYRLFTKIRHDVQAEGGDLSLLIAKVRTHLQELLEPYAGEFGFVYSDLPGSQDTVPFTYDMNGQDDV